MVAMSATDSETTEIDDWQHLEAFNDSSTILLSPFCHNETRTFRVAPAVIPPDYEPFGVGTTRRVASKISLPSELGSAAISDAASLYCARWHLVSPAQPATLAAIVRHKAISHASHCPATKNVLGPWKYFAACVASPSNA